MEAMTAPSGDHRQVPAYVALVRIGAVVGMSTAVAFGLFILLLGSDYVIWGLAFIALAIPCFAVMRLVERTAEPPEAPPPA